VINNVTIFCWSCQPSLSINRRRRRTCNTFFCDHLHSRIKHWPRPIRPSYTANTSRSQTFPFDFKCYCGWAQIVRVICAGYLLFSARSTKCLYTASQKCSNFETSFEYFCQISSKSIIIILSYRFKKLGRF